ncbi:MAG: fibronectin type III-like domain-contianing protein, partial [Candidatus Brocadiaceae bacterium]
EASVEVPRCALKAFRRVSLAAGESATVEFRITPEMMELVNEEGESVLEPGAFTVTVGGCSPGARGEQLGAPEPASADFKVV